MLELVPPSETAIVCNTPDGTKIEVDALELELMIIEVYNNEEQELLPRRTLLSKMCDLFEKEYGFRMSKLSMDSLISLKSDMMNKLKKNIYHQYALESSTESPQEPIESSSSTENAKES